MAFGRNPPYTKFGVELRLTYRRWEKREVLFNNGLPSPWDFSVCKDGHIILGKESIWKTEMTGRNPQQLTTNKEDDYPACSPGSDAVIYVTQQSNETSRLMKVSINGGAPTVSGHCKPHYV